MKGAFTIPPETEGSSPRVVENVAPSPRTTLDPGDWGELRTQAHTMLDDMFDHMANLREEPLWRDPGQAREPPSSELPRAPSPLSQVHETFMREILPFGGGNAHPGFMGWVQGGGSAVGMLAEMLGAGLNANVGGRNHMAVQVEREVLEWTRRMFGFPVGAGGLFVTGASAANHIGVLVACNRRLGPEVRTKGVGGARLAAYASSAAHGCLARAMEMAGLGSDALRRVPTGADHRIDLGALRFLIARDRAAGIQPFLIIGTAGSVDIGAVDDLQALADISALEGTHFHVDGAFGALGVLSPEVAPRLAGMERADSLAFDWHKWGQVPYDAGYILVREARHLQDTFGSEAAYLQRAPRGLAAGEWWPCDHGPDLSRSFKALKVWFTLKTYGADALGGIVTRSCELARSLAQKIAVSPELELLATCPLNIVAFGWRHGDTDAINAEIVMALHEEGRVAPSLTTIAGRKAIRAAFINHRSEDCDVDALLEGVLRLGRSLSRRAEAA